MPIFRFNCEDCGEDFELLLNSAKTAVTCLSCGSIRAKKRLNLINTTATSCKSSNDCANAHRCSGSCGCNH